MEIDGGWRVDIEMQKRVPLGLASRLVYYAARDYAGQLLRGDSYQLLTPTIGIIWLVEPLIPRLERLHSVFELRERTTATRLCDQLAIHLLQISHFLSSRATGYTASVERWARFFGARDDAELDRLASEHPIMSLAKNTLEQLSLDPDTLRMIREREDEIKLYRIDLAMSRAAGRAEGEVSLLLKQLGLRFGSLSPVTRARVEAATPELLGRWAERVLTARTLDDVFAP